MLTLKHATSFRSSLSFEVLTRSIIVLVPLLFIIVTIRATSLRLILPHRTLAFICLPILGTIVVPVSRSRTYLEFVQLVPFSIGTIPLRNGEQFANPTAHIDWLQIIHVAIMDYRRLLIQPYQKSEQKQPLKIIVTDYRPVDASNL